MFVGEFRGRHYLLEMMEPGSWVSTSLQQLTRVGSRMSATRDLYEDARLEVGNIYAVLGHLRERCLRTDG